ncbi:MAG: type II toxin-antitoxin system VapC family toxin [Betaproteobacteria bacterium]
MYALDTNTVLDYFRNRGAVAANLLAVPPRELALPAVVAYEVWFGVLGSQNRRTRQIQYEHFLATVAVLPFDSEVARQAAHLRQDLEQRGEKIGPLDTLIAATALAHNATLVSRNTREFGRVAGLNVVNWY